ncbi:MAG: cadherin-like beta sandwich domain-containing protein, partial [Candidatus Symbiothrix sp.]|nr:cadherin-like beta sandwich domain-containing protein [Candidatus Symbiothrix sp.]
MKSKVKFFIFALAFAGLSATVAEAQTATTDPGVKINGVIWATRNVDMPGTFAASPESAGMFYQWNRKVGWSSADPLVNSDGGTTWDGSYPTGDEWAAENNPCPEGWTVPTKYDIDKLSAADFVATEFSTLNGIDGRTFTDKSSGASMFMSAVFGCRSRDGSLYVTDNEGYYWSSSRVNSTYALQWTVRRYASIAISTGGMYPDGGRAVRCVMVLPKLSALSVSYGVLSPEFNPEINQYAVSVPNSVSSIRINATADEGIAVSGDGEQTLQVGENTFEVRVTRNAVENVYTVVVTRASEDFVLSLVNTANVRGNAPSTVVTGYGTVYAYAQKRLTYQLTTGNISGNINLNFEIENGISLTHTAAVESNRMYEITLLVDLNISGCWVFTAKDGLSGLILNAYYLYPQEGNFVVNARLENQLAHSATLNFNGPATQITLQSFVDNGPAGIKTV